MKWTTVKWYDKRMWVIQVTEIPSSFVEVFPQFDPFKRSSPLWLINPFKTGVTS